MAVARQGVGAVVIVAVRVDGSRGEGPGVPVTLSRRLEAQNHGFNYRAGAWHGTANRERKR